MTLGSRPTLARVDLGAIASNYRLLGARTGRRVLPVVKANAYGHGAVEVSRALAKEGADFLCVAIVEEAAELRRAGIGGRILILNHCRAADLPALRSLGVTPVISALSQLEEFARAGGGARPLAVHLKFDTGLSRLGLLASELPAAVALLKASPWITVEAVMTHFSHGDDPDDPSVSRQERQGGELFAALSAAGVRFEWAHLANSGAALAGRGCGFDAVRPGLSLYGIAPSSGRPDPDLRPALSWETEVFAVKRVPAGTAVGYGGTFVTGRPTLLAVLPVGYHDGYRRAFSGRVPVLLPGGPAATVGAISMDLTVCDATDVGAAVGDRAVLLGKSAAGAVSAHDLARAAGTIPYEILCGIGARVPRVHA